MPLIPEAGEPEEVSAEQDVEDEEVTTSYVSLKAGVITFGSLYLNLTRFTGYCTLTESTH